MSVGWQHPSVVIENEIFHNLSLKPGQNIEDFYCLLIEKGQLLSKPEHEIMAQFIKGLPEKFAFYIRASKPNDTTEALTIAKLARHAIIGNMTQPLLPPKVTKPQSDDNADMKLQRNCNWNGEGRPSTQSQCQLCSQFGHFATQCHSLKNFKKTNDIIQCQLCSKRGHSAKDCYSLQGNRNNLGAKGHDLPGGQ